ncbi:MAG: hypothetical protein B0W54_13375 [Cellvibrio sp. 79]|nr:MAG: hypothetical protein B0W54_13375 [Cellvibrio sp. 79]
MFWGVRLSKNVRTKISAKGDVLVWKFFQYVFFSLQNKSLATSGEPDSRCDYPGSREIFIVNRGRVKIAH